MRGDDVVEMGDLHRSRIRWRRGPMNRYGNLPTKHAVPQHQRAKWASIGDMRSTHSENPKILHGRDMRECAGACGMDVGVSEETHGV